jgi:dTDP-4-amino-4,6-dideoxygalactose transaminase|tara:strand:- start:2063 stop:3358 length:1296 start_codon:yes stop_codon:yes gene_type:complete
MEKLAIYGGSPIRTKLFPAYNTLDSNEEHAVAEVIREGVLSDFIGAKGEFFYGGKRVNELELMYKERCGVKHAISMNSATSVIIAAMGAFGIGPGDEVIVTPYSHVISATAPLLYDGIPVFADSEPDTFCMSVESIEKCITPRTKAMIVVDLFGQSADMDSIMDLACKHNIKVLSDSSHIVIATYKGKTAGTLADVGVYSLNGHKTIQCGEGGIAVTNDDELAFKLQLLRNHAENCVADMEVKDITNMIGYNFRMTELEAAVAIEQVKKSRYLIEHRRMLCEHLTKRISGLEGIEPPKVRKGCTHDYLLYCIRYNAEKVGISKEEFMKRLDAEGIKMTVSDKRHIPPISGFVKPIHLQPVFTQKTFRPKGYPWAGEHYKCDVTYGPGLCPIVEDLWQNTLICVNAIYPPLTIKDMDDIADAFEKVVTLSNK